MNDLGNRVREIRETLKIKQGKFAESLGLKQGSMSDIERGRVGLSGSVMLALRTHHNVNLNWLKTGEGEMFENTEQNSTNGAGPYEVPFVSLDVPPGKLKEYIEDPEKVARMPIVGSSDFIYLHKTELLAPDIKPGDMLGARFIGKDDFIQFGKFHLVETTQGILVKRILSHDNPEELLLAGSDSKDNVFAVNKKDVFSIAIITGITRRV